MHPKYSQLKFLHKWPQKRTDIYLDHFHTLISEIVTNLLI